ncbi:MAG: hypothetical protein QW404_00395 [Candidatus Nanoarchaeia archaeon]
MKKLPIVILCILALAFSASAVVYTQLDYLDIGAADDGLDGQGWSGLWTWGGNYGGGDDSNLGGGTLRTVIPRDPNCQQDDKLAYFSMSTSGTAYELKLRHLQGSQNDNYNLYYESSPGTWTQLTLGSSTDPYCVGGECWYTDSYALPGLTGTINFKIEATINPIPSWCTSWGINAFSYAQLNGVETQIPEFSAIAAGLALAGAATGFILLRRKK